MSVDMSTRYLIAPVIVRTTRLIRASIARNGGGPAERTKPTMRRRKPTLWGPLFEGRIMPVYQACENRADVGKLGYEVTGSRV